MPQFKPFKGIRPVTEIAGSFSTKSVDSLGKKALEDELASNSESFLHIIKPTWEEDGLNHNERQALVRENFLEFISSERAEKDRTAYYIYQLIKPNGDQVKGLIGMVNIQDYEDGKIKKHEETLTKRVELFANYLLNVHFHAEPVLLTYPNNQRVDLLMSHEMKTLPIVSFKDKEENEHQLWKIENRLNLLQIKDSIEKNESFYIADGHHRMESSLMYTNTMRKIQKDASDLDSLNYTLAMLVSDKELIIKDFNRLVKDLNGLTPVEFLDLLAEKFEIRERGETPFFPPKKHYLGLYLEGKFYSLYIKREMLTVEGLSELDTYLFEEFVLKPILNIQNSRDDERICFLRGSGDVDGVIELKEKVDSGEFKVGFFFYPVVSTDMEKIADLGLKMPPKSTYIEPKPLSGLTIFQLDE